MRLQMAGAPRRPTICVLFCLCDTINFWIVAVLRTCWALLATI